MATTIKTECSGPCESEIEAMGMTHRENREYLQGIGWLTLNGVWYCDSCKATVRPVPRDV